MIDSIEKLISAIYNCIPYSSQITNLKIGTSFIAFTWRGNRFKASYVILGVVELIDNDSLESGSNIAILMSAILKNHQISIL